MTKSRSRVDKNRDDGPSAITPPWPKNLDDAALRGVAGRFVRAVTSETELDPATCLFSFLTSAGSMLGRGPHVDVGATRHSTNLFCAIVAESGHGQKGAALDHLASVFDRIDNSWSQGLVEGLSSGEGLLAALGERNGASLIVESEFGATLRRGGQLSKFLRQSWDGKKLSSLTKHDPVSIVDAHVSVLAHITPSELRAKLDSTAMENGFANRFLWPLARRSKLVANPKPVSGKQLDGIAEEMRRVTDSASKVSAMSRSKKARSRYEREYPGLVAESEGPLGSILSRAAPNVIRLALIYALLDQKSQVQVQHVRSAVAAWRYASASANWILASPDPISLRLLAAIRDSSDGLSRTEIRDAFSRHHSSRIGAGIAKLMGLGLISKARRKTKGRAAEVWRATG